MNSINPQDSTIELSIIVLSYNTQKITVDCLLSIYRSLGQIKLSFEVIVADNGSTDGSLKALYQLQKKLTNFVIIDNKKNLGFSRANNLAASISRGQYLLFLNSDVIVLDEAISKLLSFAKKSQDAHFFGGKLLNQDRSAQASCGPFFTLPVVFAFLFLKGDYYGLTRYSPNSVKKVDWVSGACILTKKPYFEKCLGFDEKIFMYMEEIDLLYRAKQLGFTSCFYPEAHFVHLGSASSSQRTYPILQVYKGYLYFYHKHQWPISIFLLRLMLQFKARVAIIIGQLTKNQYLIQTYEKAYQIATMA
ncbi:hypothetical protein A2966_04720 [Candidatus Roizmanbacteria bacterium RIFCSPLOWO2_01_FULL_41_22]|uniref:Glycosyltransferase 2-like domain-containing protein n=1 Tax=Candidatus Roizmanbacteria bacterium RIFCSPLOWO2_01_FULL_41_22 TaxID=1802067 RepID=A0A1F7JAZ7_9BACT|nr:MAG: hypothetical protein A2966_04720 [Candidatus Roizmanbacteria bacterium RIFCSPLOWO2_01_FULL_41_22]